MEVAIAKHSGLALQHNLSVIKAMAPHCKILAVLKANGYGHGLTAVAERLKNVDAFGVARVSEALALRAGGVVKPIVLLEGFFDGDELPILEANNLTPVVHMASQLGVLERAQLSAPLNCWLKVDTGMHRLGLRPRQLGQVYQRLLATGNIRPNPVLMSHFACADDVADSHTEQQIQLFMRCLAQLRERGFSGETSLANSAGIVAFPAAHGTWLRPGLMLYGVSPMLNGQGADHGLLPVMTLTTKVIAVRKVRKGESVGYGASWQASENGYIGVVAMGYGDGYPRNVPHGTPVLINGKRYPIVGRVSMDMITVDLGVKPEISLGDEVVMWGKGLPIEEIAALANTIPYELLCNITRRVTNLWVD